MRYSKNEICPEILRSLAFHIVLYKVHKKGDFECLIFDQRYMVSKIGEIQPKSRVSEFLVQVYFTNPVGMFEIRVIPVLCSIISKNNGENIKILPYPL